MMRKWSLVVSAVAGLLYGISAQAETGGSAEALSYTWTGLYGGVNAGYAMQKSDWDFSGGAGSTSMDGGSGVVGIQVGYDAQIGDNLFAGLEASVDASNIDNHTRCLGGQVCETKLSSFGDLSARLGIAAGRSLWYAKGGIAYEDATHHIKNAIDNHDNGRAQFGYLLGAGIEYALMYNLTTKVEYNYMDFGSEDSRISPSGQTISAEEPIHLVKLGFNFKFQ